jgi:anti-sigma factor RsiW
MKKSELESLYYKTPESLRQKLISQARTAERGPSIFHWLSYASGLLALVAVAFVYHTNPSSSLEDQLAQEVVSSHVRSMMASHLIDVVSSDRHTVKPWFNGKIDFSPKVLDLSSKGFPLAGGRLDYVGSRPVAALVYRHDQHLINVLIWPSSQTAQTEHLMVRQGYNLFHWFGDGMQYWAVSDLNANDLKLFSEMIQNQN